MCPPGMFHRSSYGFQPVAGMRTPQPEWRPCSDGLGLVPYDFELLLNSYSSIPPVGPYPQADPGTGMGRWVTAATVQATQTYCRDGPPGFKLLHLF